MNKKRMQRHNKTTPDTAEFREKEVCIMETRKNPCIKCTVSQCQHNMVSENYCVLDSIRVGTHEKNPTVPECTDCESFVKRSGACTGEGCSR